MSTAASPVPGLGGLRALVLVTSVYICVYNMSVFLPSWTEPEDRESSLSTTPLAIKIHSTKIIFNSKLTEATSLQTQSQVGLCLDIRKTLSDQVVGREKKIRDLRKKKTEVTTFTCKQVHLHLVSETN